MIREKSARKDYLSQRQQLIGYRLCLEVWLNKSFGKDIFQPKLDHFIRLADGIPLASLPKWFKFILCFNFSKYTQQELPIGPNEWKVDILEFLKGDRSYKYMRTLIKSSVHRTRYYKVFWNLLQCRALSAKVPNEFIAQGYQDHFKSMQKLPNQVPIEILKEIKEFIVPYILKVHSLYNESTKKPTNHATFSSKRSEGGQLNDLKTRITTSKFLDFEKDVRIDPVVIHLEGPPGTGKSRSVSKLCMAIGKYFGYNERYSQYTYYRSAGTKHWDGYDNQLITVLDDFGYEREETTSSSSCGEIIQLCSECDYIVPMASLKDKGKKFNSPFLIVTSNLATNPIMNRHFNDPDAYMRRLSPTYKCSREGTKMYVYEIAEQKSVNCNITSVWTEKGPVNLNDIVSYAIDTYKFRVPTLSKYWYQEIEHASPNSAGLRLKYPLQPETVVNEVMTYAIPEPLKVRLITKPQGCSYALKPLQLAMFSALKEWECFTPCYDPNFSIDWELKEEEMFLSGDYTAATDELNFYCSQVVAQSLSESFSHTHPILSKYIDWESGRHLVSYPSHTGLPSVVQENGQLMGSLLSFPILCILNAFTICKARNESLDSVKALIHGDDIASVVTPQQFTVWKDTAATLGLQLSVGKNYLSRDFLSIDSQLFVPINGHLERQITGKFRLLKMDKDGLNAKQALTNGFQKKHLVKYCKEILDQTIKSLDVGVEFGGLGVETSPDRVLSFRDKAIYYYLRSRKSQVQDMGNNLYTVLKDTARIIPCQLVNLPTDLEDKPVSETNLMYQIRRLISKSMRDKDLARRINLCDGTSRPLSLFSKQVIRCDNLDRESLQVFQTKLVSGTNHPSQKQKLKLSKFQDVNANFRIKKRIPPMLLSHPLSHAQSYSNCGSTKC